MKRFDYIANGGEYNFSDPLLVGKEILAAYKDGVGCSKIVTDIPINKQARYTQSIGNMAFAAPFETGEAAIVLYQDAETVCFDLGLLSASLPDGMVGVNYTASFFVNGTLPITLSDEVKPDWMDISVSGSMILFSGVPTVSGPVTVSFNLNNCSGVPIGFSDSIDIAPAVVEVSGKIENTLRHVIVRINENLPCDVTFNIEGRYGATSLIFSVSATIPAGQYFTDVQAPIGLLVISCIQPNSGTDLFIASVVCSGITYNITLIIDNPC